jgi:hypothetical protein
MATADEVKYAVVAYFRYKRQASLVCTERALRGVTVGVPDVLIALDNRLIEVEVKVSMADFRQDAKKYKWRYYDSESELYSKRWRKKGPAQFYYAAPADLALRIKEELPEGAGLISCRWGYTDLTDAFVLATAPKLHKGEISDKALRLMQRHQTGTLCSMLKREAKRKRETTMLAAKDVCMETSHI